MNWHKSWKRLSFEEIVNIKKAIGIDPKTRNNMLKKGYAPLNFDGDNKKQCKIIEKRLKIIFKEMKDIKIYKRTSPSKKGYHYYVFHKNRQLYLPSELVLTIREAVGDCYGRLKADRQRIEMGLPIGILFNVKNKKWAGGFKLMKL